jgi:TolB-like protein/tetratricopeptide (TPR) repeat protein
MDHANFAFGSFSLDAERKILLKDGQAVPVGHRGVVLLQALLAADGRIVTKNELLDVAWPSQAVAESNLSVQIAALRKALGTRPDGEDWITTIPRVGYQFAPLETRDGLAETLSTFTSEAKSERLPFVAVLPFANLSSSQDQAFFADGMTEDIIAALSRINRLLVMSRNSSFALRGKSLSSKQVAEETGVRYILEGSVRTAAHQMRISVQLTDCHTGNAIWVDRYDVAAVNIFDVQDDVTRKIAQALQVTLTQGESVRLWEGQTRNLKAWEKAVLGNKAFHQYSTADNALAHRYLEEAVELDPDFAGALALLGITYYWDARYSVGLSRADALARAEDVVARLRKLAPDLPQLYTLNATIALVQRRHEDAVMWSTRAAQRSPTDGRAQGFLGMMQLYDGRLEEALTSIKLAFRHSPYPEAYLYYYLAIIHLWMGQLDKALQNAIENDKIENGEPHSTAYLAAVFAMRGERVEARQTVVRLRELNPGFSLRNIRHSELYREEDRLQRLIGVLAEAGLPA